MGTYRAETDSSPHAASIEYRDIAGLAAAKKPLEPDLNKIRAIRVIRG